jgi:hypothetical protein
VCQVGKTGVFADLRDGLVRFHELALGVHDARNVNILHEGAAGFALEIAAQIVRADVK